MAAIEKSPARLNRREQLASSASSGSDTQPGAIDHAPIHLSELRSAPLVENLGTANTSSAPG
jgi:hypothetical protein